MPRVLRSEAHADALREWTLAEACYSWSRYVASDNDATSAAGPDDECPCAGAARNEEYLVSCDPVRLTPPSRRTTSRAFPSRPPANVTETFAPSLFARHRHFIPFPSSDAEAERRRDARATAPVPSSPSRRPRPFRILPSSLIPGTRPPSPPNVFSSRRRLDTTSPRRRLPRPRSLRPTTRSSFSSSPSRASSPRASRPSPSCIDGGGARRPPSRRNAPRAPPRPTRGTCARLAPTALRGAASRRDSAGASFEGSCTVCTC